MQNTYEIFDKVIKEKGITAYRVAKDTGLTTVLFTDWKKGKSCPKINKLQLIADYLGVTTDYLLGSSETTAPISLTDEEKDMLFLFNKLSPEDKQRAIGYLTCLCNS